MKNANLKKNFDTKNSYLKTKKSTKNTNLKTKNKILKDENLAQIPTQNDAKIAEILMQFLQFLAQNKAQIMDDKMQDFSAQEQNLELLKQILNAQNPSNLDQNLNSQNQNLSQNFTNFQPDFTNHLNNFNKITNELSKVRLIISEASQIAQKLENKELSQAELEAFLQKLNFPLLGGVALGAFASILLSEISSKE